MTSRVILLNGPGSVGKSTLAKALQQALPAPFLHVPMDLFQEMLPEDWQDHPETFAYRPLPDAAPPQTAILTGPRGDRLLSGFTAAVAALADCGIDLIVDAVLIQPRALSALRDRLSGHDLTTVLLAAPLATIEARETGRGDRMPGLARWQLPRMDGPDAHDLTLDLSALSPETAAARIVAALAAATG